MYVVFFQQKKGTKIIFSLFVIRFGSRCCLFSLQALALLLAALRLGINSTAIRTLIVIYSEIVFALKHDRLFDCTSEFLLHKSKMGLLYVTFQ